MPRSIASEPSLVSRQPLVELYQQTLASPDNQALLEQLRKHAKQVLHTLKDPELENVLSAAPVDDVPSDWLARVYEVLAEADPFPVLPIATREALLAESERDEAVIGTAFQKNLLRDLERHLPPLYVVFAHVPRVSDKEVRHLRQTPSVEASWPECSGLVVCGLTPMSVFAATDAVVPFFKRLQAGSILPQAELVILLRDRIRSACLQKPTDPVDFVVSEFLRVGRCGEEAAKTLLNWLLDVAAYRPRVFSGAWADPEGLNVRLKYESQEGMSLAQRWAFVRPPANRSQAETGSQAAATAVR
jgi:hypothetical protein